MYNHFSTDKLYRTLWFCSSDTGNNNYCGYLFFNFDYLCRQLIRLVCFWIHYKSVVQRGQRNSVKLLFFAILLFNFQRTRGIRICFKNWFRPAHSNVLMLSANILIYFCSHRNTRKVTFSLNPFFSLFVVEAVLGIQFNPSASVFSHYVYCSVNIEYYQT